MTWARVSTHLVLFGALAIIVACGESKVESQLRVFVDCMEQIRSDYASQPECYRRAREICYALSRDLPFLTRTRYAYANAKSIVSDFARLVGIAYDPWNHADCIAAHKGICKDVGLLFPCGYESCLAEISQECADYETR